MRIFLHFWTVLTILALTVALLLTAALILPRFAGLHPYPVPTDRMPDLPAGSLVYVRPVGDGQPAGDGTVICVCNPALELDRVRVTSFDDSDNRYMLEDGTQLLPANVLGIPVFSLPLLGHLAGFLARPSGTIAAICAVAILFGVRIALELVLRPDPALRRPRQVRRNRTVRRRALRSPSDMDSRGK